MVNDIVNNNSKVIFILESPHTEEIKGSLPLLGKSGEVFSQALLTDKHRPAGLQINQGNIPYSILNTFQNSLQTSNELSEINILIEKLDFNRLQIVKYKKQVNNIIKESGITYSLVHSYKERIKSVLLKSDNDVKIVVCGIIAQVFFELAFCETEIWFGKVTQRVITEKKIKILYVEHPSPKNKKTTHWKPVTGNKKLKRLKDFVGY